MMSVNHVAGSAASCSGTALTIVKRWCVTVTIIDAVIIIVVNFVNLERKGGYTMAPTPITILTGFLGRYVCGRTAA